jgi:hypothetical protein
MKKYILLALCCVALAYIGKVAFGTVDLARYQDQPVSVVVFELAMFLGAVVFPLSSALRQNKERKPWHYVAWIPCILYVTVIAINYMFRTANYFGGLLLLFLWIAIAFLFILEPSRKERTA